MQIRFFIFLPVALLAFLASACTSAGADGLVTPASDKLTFLYFYIDG